MNPISREILHFINQHVSTKLKNMPKIKLSKQSIHLISDIFEKIKRAEHDFETMFQNGTIHEKWLNFENASIPRGFDYDYSPEIAKVKIKDTAKFGCIFNLKLHGRNVQIAVIFPSSTTNNSHYCHEKLKRMVIWLHVAMQYASPECSQNLNIYLYLIDLKKHIPSYQSLITQEHANTGFTTTCDRTSEIHIYREEEWFKVLLHETFHNLGLDFSSMNNTDLNSCVYSIFPLKTEKKIFESYCEMWAEILNVVFIAYFKSKSKKIKPMIKDAMDMLEIEQEFSLLQCVKVLHFFGMTYTDLYEETQEAKDARLYKYKEQTPIFSYFIIKCILMFFVDEFIHWTAIHNGNSLLFQKVPAHLNEYCSFIREHYKDDKLLKSFSDMEKIVKKMRGGIILKTLRMTAHEI